MQVSRKLKTRTSLLLGFAAWVLFTFFDIYAIILNRYEMREDLTSWMPQVFYTVFVFAVFTFYRYNITKAESINFTDLLWKVFITGLITTIVSLSIQGFFMLFDGYAIAANPITINFFYHIYVGIVVVYAISTLVVWKRLILYQKSKRLIRLWSILEYMLYGSLIFDFFGYKFGSDQSTVALVIITGFSVVLCFNLKWIAYLNLKQKWKSILFILLSAIYLYHFLVNLNGFGSRGELIIDLMDRVFILSVFIFIFIYAAFSILVTLFNLPTSSVFESKLEEVVNFQRLSQAIPRGQSEEQIYEILLDSSMSAVFADAAWLDIRTNSALSLRNIREREIWNIKTRIRTESVLKIINFEYDPQQALGQKIIGSVRRNRFKSVLALPILTKNEQIGCLVLLREVRDAFNKEMLEIIRTFVSQASISLENALLLKDALENERYKEQLNIAKNVQKSLLPANLKSNKHFEIAAFSMAADEVGGDYYDLVSFPKNQYGLIIGDISGKGTSAAFNMAQMKGIFRSLAQLQLPPAELLKKANLAVGQCLEKSSFLTASYFLLDFEKHVFRFVRAGHCPTLMFCGETNTAEYLKTEGMGLGMLRDNAYDKFVKEYEMPLRAGDMILLYTDGITEAADGDRKQFDEQALKHSFLKNVERSPTDIIEGIIRDLHEFMGQMKLDDDYTLVLLKIK